MLKIDEILETAGLGGIKHDPSAPRLVINLNKVHQKIGVPGLEVKTEELKDGVDVHIRLQEGTVIEKPVHLCFGVTHKKAVQKILLDVHIEKNASIQILAECIFPEAEDVQHLMDAKIRVDEGAHYRYEERHIHSPNGGVHVDAKAKVKLGSRSRFQTDFELKRGRVGHMRIDYEAFCGEESVTEMNAKISGRGDDYVEIHETAHLEGEKARGVLNTRIAVREKARAEIYNTMKATAPYARGHVDCKEIVQDQAWAKAVPIVDVRNPKAHVTHEAAIGSVDNKQLETLMTRGLDEDEAADLIIAGLLS
jgi:uncharacterized protein